MKIVNEKENVLCLPVNNVFCKTYTYKWGGFHSAVRN